jgi:alpha-tubulin suppressor-like RCC1 family protein
VFGTFFEPKIIIDQDIVEVSIGGSFGIARDKTGMLWAWGKNSSGELCQKDTQTRN